MTYYRLAPAVVARFVGLAFVAAAALVFAATIVVALAHLSWVVLVVVVGVAALALAGLALWLTSMAYVVAAGPERYRIRFVRGAGVTEASWGDVADAVATTAHGYKVLVLRLRDGRTTSIPVSLLRIDKEDFVRAMQRHLQAGQHVQPLG